MTVWANGTTVMPEISSPYGYSTGYTGFHGGTDFKNFDFNCAHEDGEVIFAGWTDFGNLGGGIEVAIQHDGWVSRLLHNASVLVSVGDKVTAGQRVGVQGGSGYGRQNFYGKHCHDEVRLQGRNGVTTDPVPFFTARIGISLAGFSSRLITETSRKKATMFCLEQLGDNHFMGHLVEGGRVVLSVDNQQGLTLDEVRAGAQNQTFLFLEKFFSVGFNRADYLYSRDGWAQVSKDLLK